MGVYGMTYEQFWLDDPWKAKWYREAYVARRREENRRDWLLGAYVYNAMSTVISNAFRKKGNKPENYLEEPFPIFETEEDRQMKRQKEAAKAEAVLKSMIAKQRAEKAAKETQDAETTGS
jgi:hypothetical protein